MKYSEDISKSAEYLRLALPLMSKQAAGLHPISYSVWYEFVSGINPGLKSALGDIIKRNGVLDEAASDALFRKYVAELDEETARRIASGFQSLLSEMSRSAAETGDHADRYGDTLAELSDQLSNRSQEAANLEAGVGMLLSNTRSMQAAVASLKERLEQSRRETEALREEVSRARKDALDDALTGLLNRKGFDLALGAALSADATSSMGFSLLLADIDFFKKINDSYGHLFGDKVLRAIAQILKHNLKGKDTAARYGGEEFVVLLPDTQIHGARVVAEQIRSAIESARIKRSDNNETVATITMSFGAATYRPGEAACDLIARADAALYESKQQGRNRVTIEAATPHRNAA